MRSFSKLNSVDSKANFPELEEKILDFWKSREIFEKSLEKNQGKKRYVFLEGPPTANASPGFHHVISRAFKDLYLRYKTMQGFYVERKAGWDTHGLPVEIQVEKALNISGKPQIESLKKTKEKSIAYFNKKCQESTWKHKKDWEDFTERIGYWLDMKHPYITYENTYIETLWWIIKQIWDRKLFYQGYKVVLHCPRCGSTLSSHEVAQGYKEITEPSLYVKFALKNQKNTYILIWTTTPWTLPGNVALAIDKNIDYCKIQLENKEKLILAKALLNIINEKYHILETFKGKKLLNLKYEPLYKIKYNKKSHFVCHADFVSIEDGTGVVHTAVMYGEEDYELGKKIGLPEKHTVDEAGKFTKEVKKWQGQFVHDTNPQIIKDLENRGLLYKTESVHHTYPFCWRCDTKLIYYAKSTWYIAMNKIQKELLSENEKINWIPKHLKKGRFGEWLEEVKDWAFARERYWGTPLPIWKCTNQKCKNFECIGSLNELSEKSLKKPVKLILIRHGHSQHNDKEIYSDKVTDKYHLTPKGISQIKKVAKNLAKKYKIAETFSSDLLRCKETAQILEKNLSTKTKFSKYLREIKFGKLYNKRVPEAGFSRKNHYQDPFPGGESIADVEKRVKKLLDELKEKYAGKTVLIVSHENTLHAILVACMQLDKNFTRELDIPVGSTKEFFIPEINNLHKPYVDKVKIRCSKCKSTMQRIEEVADVWFDSGSAPFAQWHYPFENKEKIDKNESYPADYISEAIDQTRGWFYTLLAVAVLLKKERPYKNVICQGHIRDKYGKKMSKSKGNVINPNDIADKYGIDALRWYFYTVNQPGEYKNFDEKEINQTLKKYFLILWNIYSFLVTYTKAYTFVKTTTANKQNLNLEYQSKAKPKHILDRWLCSKFNSLISEVTQKMDRYDVVGAGRSISDFIDIFSTWYLRRSRKRLTENTSEAKMATNYFYSVLLDLCKLIAPFSPFMVETIYQNLRSDNMPESIHLCDFPKVNPKLIDKDLEKQMDYIREVASLALSLRAKAKIKVRQPLETLYIKKPKKLKWSKESLNLILEEVNVEKIKIIEKLFSKLSRTKSQTFTGLEVALDTTITPKLKEKGILNEILRNNQALRKTAGLDPRRQVTISAQGFGSETLKIAQKYQKEIEKKNNLKAYITRELKNPDLKKEVIIEDEKILLALKK